VTRRHVAALVVAASLALGGALAVTGAPWPAQGASSSAPERAAGPGPQGRVPQFVIECGWSHRAADDPIVAPGHAGHSHLHDFFGSTITDAESTAETLRQGGTTCDTKQDTAAYWAPALLSDDGPVAATKAVAYYRPGPGVEPSQVHPYPFGLAMVAGDADALDPQPTHLVGWHCGAGARLHHEPPDCPPATPLSLRVVFPDCWDGIDLDSHDHRVHVAYSTGGKCPASKPVAVPQLTLDIAYRFSGPAEGLVLSSGPISGAHADFLNAWDPQKLSTEVELCLNRGAVCGVASNRATG
jgi:hypothetical protein